VLFLPRGNSYLTQGDSARHLEVLIRNKLPASLPGFKVLIKNDQVTLERRHLSIVFQLRLNANKLVLVDFKTSMCKLVKEMHQRRFDEETKVQTALRILKEKEIFTLQQATVEECVERLMTKTIRML
jgi:hypothetical protein